jgi:geranylgeranyl pyrophosphate synthase
MIHTASLVHDDVLDEADTRRGVQQQTVLTPQSPLTMQLHHWKVPIVSVPDLTCAGQPTVNKTHGNQRAVLVGDFLFARSSYLLAHLEDNEACHLVPSCMASSNHHEGLHTSMDIFRCHARTADHLHGPMLQVIKLISQVIADFADGEIDQSMHKVSRCSACTFRVSHPTQQSPVGLGSSSSRVRYVCGQCAMCSLPLPRWPIMRFVPQFDTDLTMEDYIQKSYYKTASLIAASCRASAIFSDVDAATKAAMFEYGRHLGLAFQVVDDILDFTRTAEQLGKPQVRCQEDAALVATLLPPWLELHVPLDLESTLTVLHPLLCNYICATGKAGHRVAMILRHQNPGHLGHDAATGAGPHERQPDGAGAVRAAPPAGGRRAAGAHRQRVQQRRRPAACH